MAFGLLTMCQVCKEETKTRVEVPICDKNPDGFGCKTPEAHGNIIEGVATCSDEYCHPDNTTLEDFYAEHGTDEEPGTTFRYCEKCGGAKQLASYDQIVTVDEETMEKELADLADSHDLSEIELCADRIASKYVDALCEETNGMMQTVIQLEIWAQERENSEASK